MLTTIDTVIAFAVIMTVLSLLITLVVQMVSAAFSLRGKNLANALALTFQTIDPTIGKYAHSMAAQILRDPIFSDSIWRKKVRPILDEAAEQFIAAERKLGDARLRSPDDPNRESLINQAASEVQAARQALRIPDVKANREKPWGFWTLPWGSAVQIATAIRPGEIYRVLQEFREMSHEEAQLRDIPKELVDKAAGLIAILQRWDQAAIESRVKLADIAKLSKNFQPEQKVVLDALPTFGATLERATTHAYDRFQRWFGSAQDRAEQWFQIHVRIVTIVAAILVTLFLQLDTMDIYRQLRDEPKLTDALVKAAPDVLEKGGTVQGQPDAETREKTFADLKAKIDSTGFELLPSPVLGRWAHEGRAAWPRHLFGLALTAGLLTLGAPFWFNLLKNLTSLRPAVATLIEKRPTSAPALPPAPPPPPAPS